MIEALDKCSIDELGVRFHLLFTRRSIHDWRCRKESEGVARLQSTKASSVTHPRSLGTQTLYPDPTLSSTCTIPAYHRLILDLDRPLETTLPVRSLLPMAVQSTPPDIIMESFSVQSPHIVFDCSRGMMLANNVQGIRTRSVVV